MEFLIGELVKKWGIDDIPVAVTCDRDDPENVYYLYLRDSLYPEEISAIEQGGYEVDFRYLEVTDGWHVFEMNIVKGLKTIYSKKYQDHALTAVSLLQTYRSQDNNFQSKAI